MNKNKTKYSAFLQSGDNYDEILDFFNRSYDVIYDSKLGMVISFEAEDTPEIKDKFPDIVVERTRLFRLLVPGEIIKNNDEISQYDEWEILGNWNNGNLVGKTVSYWNSPIRREINIEKTLEHAVIFDFSFND